MVTGTIQGIPRRRLISCLSLPILIPVPTSIVGLYGLSKHMGNKQTDKRSRPQEVPHKNGSLVRLLYFATLYKPMINNALKLCPTLQERT